MAIVCAGGTSCPEPELVDPMGPVGKHGGAYGTAVLRLELLLVLWVSRVSTGSLFTAVAFWTGSLFTTG